MPIAGLMNSEPEDNQIVTAVLCGDVDAFEQLIRRYHGPLRRLAINRVGHTDRADDIVQETFIAAYRSLHTYKTAYSFRTWLWTILINQCRRHSVKSAKQPLQFLAMAEEGLPVAIGSDAPLPEARMLAQEQTLYLQELLDQLPQSRADAVRLRFFGELKYREIADTLDCSLSAAKKWVREGLLAMSESIRQTDSAHPQSNTSECDI